MVNDERFKHWRPKESTYYLCRPNVPRGLDVSILAEAATKASLKNSSFTSVQEATAQSQAKDDDIIYVGGSTFVIAEVVTKFLFAHFKSLFTFDEFGN